MKKAALIVAPGFEESEALTITDIIRRAQLGCDLVGLWNEIVEGAHGITVKCDRTLQQVMKEENTYDMVILPGGYGGVDAMKGDSLLHTMLEEMSRKKRYICAICAAPAVLDAAGLLDGRSYTAYPGYDKKICSGQYLEKNVVVDGNIVTGRGPAMAYAFGYQVAGLLGGDVQAVKDRMLYSHSFREEG